MNFNFSDRLDGLEGTATREILRLTHGGVISFAGGLPAADLMPIDKISRAAFEILNGGDAQRVLQYAMTEGFDFFRDAVRGYVRHCGIDAKIDNIMAISGGQQGIELMCKAFLNKGDVVLVDEPTYLAALQIVKSFECRCVGVENDDDGNLSLSDFEQKLIQLKPKFFYCVPTFANPTGKTYSLSMRRQIVKLCESYGVMVLEDDPYSKLRYENTPLNALKSFDTVGNVVYVTSFSKVLAPSLRVGALVAHPQVIKKLVVLKQGEDVQTNGLAQAVVARLIESGEIDEIIRLLVIGYKERRDAMVDAIGEFFPKEFVFSVPSGGMFIWGGFEGKINTAKLLGEALERNTAYICGREFFANGGNNNTIRLNFSAVAPLLIRSGIKTLGGLFCDKLACN